MRVLSDMIKIGYEFRIIWWNGHNQKWISVIVRGPNCKVN